MIKKFLNYFNLYKIDILKQNAENNFFRDSGKTINSILNGEKLTCDNTISDNNKTCAYCCKQ